MTQFGAVGNAATTTGSIAASSNSLNVANAASFTVGQGINIAGAGSGGGNLVTTIAAISGNAITLAASAATAASGAAVVTDDTAAIQAAFNACWNLGVPPHGGVVEFPGARTYNISSTINAYDSCKIEGVNESYNGVGGPAQIFWTGGTIQGTVYTISQFTTAVNAAPLYTASSPNVPSLPTANTPFQPYIVTLQGTNGLAVNNWVLIQGCGSAQGLQLNHVVAQVAAASQNSFTITVPWTPPYTGTYSDTCTATTVNVGMATDANAKFEEEIDNIEIANAAGIPTNQSLGVDLYFGTRIDAGTRIDNSWIDDGLYYDYYFSNGGINVEFAKGWRCDSGGACIYWRVGGNDGFGLANGTMTTPTGTLNAPGGQLVLDNGGGQNGYVHLTIRNVKSETQLTPPANTAVIALLDTPSGPNPQFDLNFDQFWVVNQNGYPMTAVMMYPANDQALTLTMENSLMPMGTPAQRWSGLPSLLRQDTTGYAGVYPLFSYVPPSQSIALSGALPTQQAQENAEIEFLGDVGIGQLWQYGTQASAFLYSDTAFAALPNATTLFQGQILAPPAYWNGANGSRYALDVVYQTGTTGIPNGGGTTCESTATYAQLVCSSAADLSFGQHISVGAVTNAWINRIDATNPNAVILNVSKNVGTIATPTALVFSAPVLGPEMQLPTKSASAPSSLAWSQGDVQQNSGATANGVAAWVNVNAGTPGTWAGVPLGNSSGQITPAQITTPSTTVNGTTCALGSSCTVTATPTPTAAKAAGDLTCAMAADTSIGATSITGGSTTGSAATLTFSSAPGYYYAGQKIGVMGATPSGLNGGPYTLTAATSTSVTFASAVASGGVSGAGTAYLWCANQTTDWTTQSSSREWANTYTVPTNYFATNPKLTASFTFDMWSSSNPPAFGVELFLGSTVLYEQKNGSAMVASSPGYAGVMNFQTLGNSTTEVSTALAGITIPTSSPINYTSNLIAQPVSISASSATLGLGGYWLATGVASITSSSGCSVVGSIGQTVLLTSFNNSSTATATGTLTAANTVAGATWVITSRGQGATAAPTSATCSAGTATSASGTATIATTLGGTPGNAALNLGLVVTPY